LITSIGPDWVAKRQAGRDFLKLRLSMTRKLSPMQKTPFGSRPKFPGPSLVTMADCSAPSST
jgi:hypothetical protein